MSLRVEKLNIEAKMKGGSTEVIVSDLSFTLERGKKLAIVGRSGCGKTMTAMAILGLLPDNCTAKGRVAWNGKELLALSDSERRKMRGLEHVLIPQSGADFLNPSLKIKTQLRESLKRAAKADKNSRGLLMDQILTRVGFDEPKSILNSYPFQLSGGMAQRVVMAIALSGTPGLVIADEPTRGVDQENTQRFLRQLDELFDSSAVLLITHDISVAATCDDILVIDTGRCVEYGPSAQIINHPKEMYTQKLICDLPHALSHAERGLQQCF